MTATVPLSPARKGKQHLLTSCAIAAGIAALAYGGPALAQVAGTGTFASGTGSITNNGLGNSTTVNVDGAQTIINWVPTDGAATGGAIDFLPVGENWNFSGSGDYTVLNRFVDSGSGALSRQIALNGTVNSTDVLTSGGRGGNIWFYNAGGILIGATGVVNVGSLVLTTNDIITTGGLFGPGGTIRFNGAAASTSAVTVNGAINANKAFNAGNSYVALVAPRVVQAGAVRVDGSVAYVAAEQAEIRINGGLFDINVTTGAEGGNAITHTGTTTGPAHQQGDTDQSRIYMVAIPKNDAVTMLVSGQIGYDDALSAQIDPDGAIRLSAGYNVIAGELDVAPANATAANLTINDTLFRSNTVARASGALLGQPINVTPPPLSETPATAHVGRVVVQGDGTFIGDASAILNFGVGQTAGVTGNLVVQSNGVAGGAGNAAINVNGGAFASLGSVTISADGAADPVTGAAVGGNASLRVENGGSVNVTGDINVTADAFGGFDDAGDGGNGTGGTATINLLGGTITATDIAASAAGFGGVGAFGSDQNPSDIIPGGLGGVGRGGTATINIDGTAVVNAGAIQANALGTGGAGGEFFNFSSFGGVPGTPGNGGEGIGGAATVNVLGGTTTSVDMIADASGIGGDGGNSFFSSSSGGATGVGTGGTGGTGRGGTATIALESAVAVTNLINSVARGAGGDGGNHNVGGSGGDGFGGLSQAIVTGFDVGDLTVILDSSAQGGAGADANDGDGGNGGNAVGGIARAQADGAGGGVSIVNGNFITGATGGDGGSGRIGFGGSAATAPIAGNGGNGTGGTIEAIASNGATLAIDATNSGGIASLDSQGRGGAGATGAGFFGGTGGDGGDGGAGIGGSVNLIANGGTVALNGNSLTVTVNGISGEPGMGNDGSSGPGAPGATSPVTGGNVLFQASNGPGGPGRLDLGFTAIDASGDAAGRVVFRGDGSIEMTELNILATGVAAPTNNDVDTAASGIFFAPVAGGSIRTTGDMELTTDGSVGIYAQSGGAVAAGGAITIQAGDQVDIRHGARPAAASTVQATGDLSITAGTSIRSTPGSQLSAGATLSLTGGGPAATITVDRLDGTDIVITSSGAASVEHAEAVNDFDATAASFRTGLNSIITGGDISINSPGAVDLGNSSAGGFVQVQGETIAFNNIVAGTNVGLTAIGNVAGVDGIRGGSINAGGDINLAANSIALSGTATGNGSFFAFGNGGAVAVDDVDVDGSISIFSAADLGGTYVAGGNIFLNSTGNITASAQANGGYVDGNGIVADGNLFVAAGGDVTLTDSSAARMFGVSAGQAASIVGGSAGEDLLMLAGTTANLANFTAGDDIMVEGPEGITVQNVVTTGVGADTANLGTFTSASVSFVINTAAPDGANIDLTSSDSSITGGATTNANGNLTADAAIDITQGNFAAGSTLSLTAQGAIDVDRLDATDIVLNSVDATSVEHAEAANDFTATAGSFRTGLNSIITGGDISVTSPGAVDLGNSTAGGFVQVTGQSISFNTIDAGTSVGLIANGTAAGAEGIDGGSIDAGGGITLSANSIAVTGTVTGDGSLFAFGNGGAVSVNNADVDGTISIFAAADLDGTYVSGGNIFLNSNGNITASAQANGGYIDPVVGVATDGNLFVAAAGDVTLTDSSAARMFGVSAGQAASIVGGSAGEDLLMLAGTTANLADFTAGDDITVQSGEGISVQNVVTTGAGADTANLGTFTSASVSFVINTAAPDGANIVLTSLDAGIVGGGTIDANGDLTATAATDITQGSFIAGTNLAMTAGATIDIVGATGGSVALDGETGVAADAVTSQGLTSLTANGGAIAIDNLSSVGAVSASANSILVSNGGPLQFATLTTDVGNATISTAGALTVANGTVAGTADLRSTGGALTVNNLTAANATLNAAGPMSLGGVAATGNVNANALTSLSVTGIVNGTNIALASADIILGSAAQVGTAGVTQQLSVTNNNDDNQTFIGGTGTRSGYHLDASELTRLYGTQIAIVGPEVQAAGGGSVGSAAPPDVIVDSFTMTGGGSGSNLGANGALTISTPGKMRVIGNVALTGLTDANTLNLVADDALEVILGQGTVRLVNGTAPAGQLNLVSDDVIVATQAAIAAVGAATTTNEISTRLGENDGVVLDEGALFARGIRADVSGGFYVQNSGASTELGQRRGLTFGAGGLSVQTQGPSRVVLNGVQFGANGQVTGLDVIPLFSVVPQSNGVPGTIDPRSTINGCLISNPLTCTTVLFDFESNFPVQDIIEEETESDDATEGSSLPVPLITMRDIDALTGEPLLDDPVTGSGNDDLWTAPTE